MKKNFTKHYNVAIDTVPLPEKPSERIDSVMEHIAPIINQMVHDAMDVAIGTWPTPEKPQGKQVVFKKKEPELVSFKKNLIENRDEFLQQLEKVKKEYPLVALALEIQKATLKDIVESSHVSSLDSVQLYEAIFNERLMESAEIEQNQRLTSLIKCIGRAKRDHEKGLKCFDKYNERPYLQQDNDD